MINYLKKLFLAVSITSMIFVGLSSSVMAEEALDDAVDYAMGMGGGGLPTEMTDKYDLPGQMANLKCVYDDNNTNLNVNTSSLKLVKPKPTVYSNSDISLVLGEIASPVMPAAGLTATTNCGPR